MSQGFTSEKFFSTWQHVLENDFAKDGQSATYFPGHPRQWGNETARIDFDGCPSLSDDGTLLGIYNPSGEARIYEVPSFTLYRTLRGPLSLTMAIQFQPARGKNGKVLTEGFLVENNQKKRWIKCHDLKDEIEDPFKEAANAAALVAFETILKRGDYSEADVEQTKIRDNFYDVLSLVQLGLQKDNLLEGSLMYGRTFSRDGSFFLYCREGNTVVAVDSESLQERYSLAGAADYIVWAETSPDDTIIATISSGQIRIWDAANGKELRTLTGGKSQPYGAFSSDGKLICAGVGNSEVRIWAVENGEPLHTLGGFQQSVRRVAFSPDGKSLAAGSGMGIVKVFDVLSGQEKQNWLVRADSQGRIFADIHGVFYTSKGLLVFSYDDGRVYTYDEKTNQKGQYEYGPGTPLSAGHFYKAWIFLRYRNKLATPDGKMLISADFDGHVRIWSLL